MAYGMSAPQQEADPSGENTESLTMGPPGNSLSSLYLPNRQ